MPPHAYPALLLASPAWFYDAGLLRTIVPLIAGGRTARDPRLLSGQAAARLMAWRMPDARGLIVEGAGHLLLLDQPETVVEEIHAFLDA